MKISQGWYIETIDGRQFLVGINGIGIWVGLRAAIDYKQKFYGIEITGKKGTEEDLLALISEENTVFFTNVKTETRTSACNEEYEVMTSFELLDSVGKSLFEYGDVRFITERVSTF